MFAARAAWPCLSKENIIEASTITPPTVLQATALRFSFPGQELFGGLSLRVPAGVTLVRGGDGRGKSTLLRLLAGALLADAGRLRINGLSLDAEPAAYRGRVFWADPDADAFEQMTARDYFASVRGRYPGFDERALAALIEGLSLGPHLDKFLYMLSTGSKRKVWLAAAFASGAVVVLLDQPFASLDKISIAFVLDLLRGETRQGARAWVVADYEAPRDVPLAALIDLGD
ncbi:MAG TPA: ABC transporter [Janthinobacterium sp.]|nr:ABC transporter [Janthinobacterium sp.]